MLLKYYYDSDLAHASYLVGCQKTGEALVVDPSRQIAPYLETAEQEGMRIVGAAETHIHADYVSGSRELAARTGARLYLSDEGDKDWKYQFADEYDSQLLKDGDHFMVGNVRLDVLHTPGHTPESISFLLTDLGGGADAPMGIFTGDFVFVGATGRPDLLEKAAGVADNAKVGARQMYRSLKRFRTLPSHLQIWPAHGAGSACGKGLGAIPSSTVGYELLFNPALQYESEEEFIDYLLADQPEVPPYFAVMKRVNKEGPALVQDLPMPVPLEASALEAALAAGQQVIDVRDPASFARGHVPGTINISRNNLAGWAGWLVDYDRPLEIIAGPGDLDHAVRVLREVGVDQVRGYYDADAVAAAGLNREGYRQATPEEVAEHILKGEVTLVDVRAQSEWEEGRLPNAHHLFLGTLPETAPQVANGKPVVVQCRSGVRSAIGASVLQAAGAENVINLVGGFDGWNAAGLPVEN